MRFGRPERDMDVTTPLTSILTMSPDAAFEHAYESHWLDVFRFALSWTNDWGAAEDLAQEAFLRLWDRRSALDWSRSALPWLLVATRRLATDRFRRLQRKLIRTHERTTVDDATRDRWLDLQAAMARLSPLERAAIVLTAIEDVPSAEAGELLGISPGAVRAAVSRAPAKLEAS